LLNFWFIPSLVNTLKSF